VKDITTLQHQLTSQGLFDIFKAQLAKDFEQSNFPSAFIASLQPDYSQIHARIVRELQDSQKKADANIMQLLYRVDISEAQLKRYLQEQKDEDMLHVIAELIIKRVLQKVVIREMYKKQ
jgi:hypothetical protein